MIAEGAGALAPAAALSGRAGEGKIVCIVSGGNIDFPVLSKILAGETPLGEQRAVVAQRVEDGVDVLFRVVRVRRDAQVAVPLRGDDPALARAQRRARSRPST